MKRNLIFLLIFFTGVFACSSLTVKGQGIEELVKNRNKRINFERKPALLPGIREADITWSKIVWRMIDMREKMNQQFYFPSVPMQDRVNLINLLLKGIKDQAFAAFDPDQGDEFSLPLSYDQVLAKFGKTSKTILRRNLDTQQMDSVTIKQDTPTDEVKQLLVKEIWYFDKQRSSLQVRILGLCPIRLYYRESDVEQTDLQRTKLFWVQYPEIRTLLAKNECLNPTNSSRSFSFDDLFLMRYFDGYIVQEENVYNNRNILLYASGEFAQQESERIKNAIFNYEQDLWEY
jgi:gliding motility associated protien GldN